MVVRLPNDLGITLIGVVVDVSTVFRSPPGESWSLDCQSPECGGEQLKAGLGHAVPQLRLLFANFPGTVELAVGRFEPSSNYSGAKDGR